MGDGMIAGLKKINNFFSDEDKKKDILKKSIIPLGLATIGGLYLLKRRGGRGWGPGERDRFIREIGKDVEKELKRG